MGNSWVCPPGGKAGKCGYDKSLKFYWCFFHNHQRLCNPDKPTDNYRVLEH